MDRPNELIDIAYHRHLIWVDGDPDETTNDDIYNNSGRLDIGLPRVTRDEFIELLITDSHLSDICGIHIEVYELTIFDRLKLCGSGVISTKELDLLKIPNRKLVIQYLNEIEMLYDFKYNYFN